MRLQHNNTQADLAVEQIARRLAGYAVPNA